VVGAEILRDKEDLVAVFGRRVGKLVRKASQFRFVLVCATSEGLIEELAGDFEVRAWPVVDRKALLEALAVPEPLRAELL
jgi:hypothetical protein